MPSDDPEYALDALDQGSDDEPSRAKVFEAFKSPLYTTDADGWLIYYNDAAADLWGYHPELGKTRWCGAWRTFTIEGALLPPDQSAMAVSLKEGRAVRGVQAVLERPDGTLIPFRPHPTPLRDASGVIVRGSNVLLPLAPKAGPQPFDLSSDAWTEVPAPDLPEGLELGDLTVRLQAILAVQADVEFGYLLDCERLDEWSGPSDEKHRILQQLEQKRQRQRTALGGQIGQLQQRAREVMARSQADVGNRVNLAAPHSSRLH